MTTRRNILKGGAGLAAILASGKAPAALVKAMLAARHGLCARGENLPFDSRVEYIESTGGQFVDTGVYPTSDIGASLDFLVTGRIASDSCLIGAGSDTWRWGFGYRDTGYQLQISGLSYKGNSWINYSVPIERTEILFNFTNDKKCYRNGSLLRENIPYGNVVSPGPIFLFGFNYNGNGTLWRGSVVRIYSCKIVDNGVLVRDFIPVRVGTTGYMYDRVTGQLFGNQGTGDFVVGPDVVEVEYLESTGTQWIDTGVSLNDGNVECGFQFVGSENNAGILGYSVYGAWKGTSVSGLTAGCGILTYNNKITFRYGNAQTTAVIPLDNVRHVFRTNNKVMSLDDAVGTVSGKVTSTSGDVVDTFTLFGERVNGGPDFHFGKVKIYSFKCGSSIDLAPVRVGSEGAMMDRLTNKIYRNAGTGAFLRGSDAPRKMGGGGWYNLICAKRSYRRSSWPSARCWREAA